MLPGIATTTLLAGAAGSSPVVIFDDTIDAFGVSSATASWTLNSSGLCTDSKGGSYTWRLAGASADYEVSFNGGASWLSLSSSRGVSLFKSTPGVATDVYDVRIRNAASLIELAGASISLIVEVGT